MDCSRQITEFINYLIVADLFLVHFYVTRKKNYSKYEYLLISNTDAVH